jgi:hypothetical protein
MMRAYRRAYFGRTVGTLSSKGERSVGFGDELNRCSVILAVVLVSSREFADRQRRLHRDRAFSVQLTRPYALEASCQVRLLRSSRRVRVASRMAAIAE